MITVDLLRSVPLFASLPASELETLAARGADIRLRAGNWLIHEGELPLFFLLLEGRVEVRKVIHGVDRLLTTYAPGEYFGEVPLLLGSPAVASLRAGAGPGVRLRSDRFPRAHCRLSLSQQRASEDDGHAHCVHGPHRARGTGRPGRDLFADRELPRLSDGRPA
jgi:thioredoxin reductase (NADPH)